MKYIFAIIKLIKWMAPVLCILAAAFCLIIMFVFLYKKLKNLDVSGFVQQQKNKKMVRKRNRQAQRGVWQFPSEYFYLQCADCSITGFDSDYSVQKATNIILTFANDEGIKQDSLQKYLIPDKFYEYYKQGKKIVEHKISTNAILGKQPRKATPIYSETVFFRRVANLTNLTGQDKRRQMLQYLLGDFQHEIEVKKEYETNLGVFEAALMLQNQKEYIPDQTAMNAKLRQNVYYLMCGIPDLPYNMDFLEECVKDVAVQLENVNSKVVLSSPSDADILNNFQFFITEVKKGDGGVLHISLSVTLKKPFDLDVPQNINMTVDGVLKGTVMFENSPVGEVLFPLPLYGIPVNANKTTKLIGLCDYFVTSDHNLEVWNKFTDIDSPNHISEILGDILGEKFDGSSSARSGCEYTVKMADDQNLWIMEV